ncbi:putative Mannosyltransferase (PIG-V) [Leishmania naiffi]|uniref:GPI mannosyltransferase 2 n=1 Tax=Leishmania naiffi TaxID=5678 RepID=A0AAW3BW22_9TRYP
MNYFGYQRFVLQVWNATDKARIVHALWNLYPMLQEKHWGVSLFSAYTSANFPNVVLALPVALLTIRCICIYYLAPAWRTKQQRMWIAAVALVRSSNVVHLLALLALALTVMHVQVTNRFVMACPALYWLLGTQLATRPTSLVSELTLLWCILWGMLGGIFFPNHLPWT